MNSSKRSENIREAPNRRRTVLDWQTDKYNKLNVRRKGRSISLIYQIKSTYYLSTDSHQQRLPKSNKTYVEEEKDMSIKDKTTDIEKDTEIESIQAQQ